MTKYIIVMGGTATGTGKTAFSASLGYILSTYGLNVSMVKFDGILNIDFEHCFSPKNKGEIIWDGEEIFITKDEEMVDSDLGVYERFLDKNFSKKNNIVNGNCYYELMNKQLKMKFKRGEIISINSHVIPLYIKKIAEASNNSDVCIIEIGGTIGDYESLFFSRAIGILKDKNKNKTIFILYSYLPLKSRTEFSEKEPFLLKVVKQNFEKAILLGLKPDFLAIRSDYNLEKFHKERITRDTFLNEEKIINIKTSRDQYNIPIEILNTGEHKNLINDLGIDGPRIEGHLEKYSALGEFSTSKILIIGETESSGSFISLKEAIKHAMRHLGKTPVITWIKGNQLENFRRDNILEDYNYVVITDGMENIPGKDEILKNKSIPLLCIGPVCKKFKNLQGHYFILRHEEYASRPMNPTLLKFFNLQWREGK